MSDKTKIQWTDATWNTCIGCIAVSAGCNNCYARKQAERFRGIEGHFFEKGFDFTIHKDKLDIPLHWRKPRRIFVNSMGDTFFDEVPDEFIIKLFEVMEKTPWHTYQVLTKRPKRMLQRFKDCYKKPCPSNVWLGVTVENSNYIERIQTLKKIQAPVKFVSFEPLIGNVEATQELLDGISWVIVGGETGPKARQMKKEWVEDIYRLSQELDIPIFFKQWGEYSESGVKVGKDKAGTLYNGCSIQEYPLSIK